MNLTIKDQVRERIETSPQQVFLRKDFENLGTYRQLSRVLGALQEEEVVVRAGYGVYIRPEVSTVETAVRQVRERLGRRVKRYLTIAGITVALGETKPVVNKQTQLDERKLATAKRVLQLCTVQQIRRKSLANIERWTGKGTWVSAFDEWRQLMEQGTDEEIVAVMTGSDERSNRLRQSAPYAGLLDLDQLEQLH